MKKFILIVISLVTLFWYGLQGERVMATTKIEVNSDTPPTNLTGADLTGANIDGVNFDGVILCNTTMPNGKINNTSCKD